MSNIKDIQVLNEKAIAVLLPGGAVIAGIYKNELLFTNKAKDDPYPVSMDDIDGIDLPPGSWSILGMSDKCADAEWKKVVECQRGHGKFRDYSVVGSLAKHGTFILLSPTESGHSLLESIGITTPQLILINNG